MNLFVNRFLCLAMMTVGLALTASADVSLPTGYGDPSDDIASGSIEGLTWQGAARSYTIGDDVVIVFTNTTAGSCSFTLADGYRANGRYLLVGGGGAGGSSHGALIGAGGGAGGFLTGSLDFEASTYSVTVGQGGATKTNSGVWDKGDNGGDSGIESVNGSLALAKGGGAGGSGSGNTTNLSGANGGSGGGASKYQDGSVGTAGSGTEGQGFAGGGVTDAAGYGGGGGGAGEPGANAVSAGDGVWHGGEGGDGKESDITGESIYYAGGGAGGSSEWYGDSGQEKLVQGGLGGGGYSHISRAVEIASAGTDGLGGGGAGASVRNNDENGHTAGRGGNGVVVVRFTDIVPPPKPDVIHGLSFTGATEFFNIGEGDAMETVLVFKNTETAGSFTLEGDAHVRVLLVGGGGAGSFEGAGAGNLVGAGGGAGGFVEENNVELGMGTYSVTVGKGGEPAGNKDTRNSNPNGSGTDSTLTGSQGELYRAIGGGAGGISNGNNDRAVASGKDGGSGGGAGGTLDRASATAGSSLRDQGHAGGKGGYIDAAGGGGGAGEPGVSSSGDKASGRGGDGMSSDITGEDVWYAGGGAGGAWSNARGDKTVAGGKGGGGKSFIHVGNTSGDVVLKAYDGEDGTGGGGAGAAGVDGAYGLRIGSDAGCGGDGIVIVRVRKIYPNEPLPGVSFEGAAEWYNIGHGKTRETVVVYTNVNEVGKLTLDRRATARVLLVGGGGAGGYTGAYNLLGGGGGAGGVVSNECAELKRGVYEITVGKGGLPSDRRDVRAANGGDSILSLDDADVYRALGGGAGGNANGDNKGDSYDNPAWGANGGCGGGGATYYSWWNKSGEGGTGSQGCNGGKARNNGNNDAGYYRSPGGGGGAGAAGGFPSDLDKAGAGGNGILSDITGIKVWYAGGGAGGTWGSWGLGKTDGGLGGGGATWVDTYVTPNSGKAEDGVDGLGGGGGGSSGGNGSGGPQVFGPGRGGNGVVIVRITSVESEGLVILLL